MNNTTKNAIKKINALPKSFDKTKTNTWIADIIVVMNTVLKLVFLHNIAARKKTNIIFTNSDWVSECAECAGLAYVRMYMQECAVQQSTCT